MHQAATLDALVAALWAIAGTLGAPLPPPPDQMTTDWMDEIEQLVLFDAEREDKRQRAVSDR